MVRSWVDQLRPLMIVWLLLTLPVVCHHETAVVLLTAAAAGHEHQHMMAEAAGAPQPAHATHQHSAGRAHGPAAPAANDASTAAAPGSGARRTAIAWQADAPSTTGGWAGAPVPTTASRPGMPLASGVPQWRAFQATPLALGLPAAADGVAVAAPLELDLPTWVEDAPRLAAVPAPDPQRHAPPAPPPRALLG